MADETIPSGIVTIEKEGKQYIPVDEWDVCIYLEKLNNGFTRCLIHNKKPRMCRLYNCLTEKKIKYIQAITEELKDKCD